MPGVGDVVGSYRLEAELGAGGMGRVFRAKHTLLGRIVAIKLLDEELGRDSHHVSRFFNEARIVNEIRHPNIIDVVDYISQTSPACNAYVMELLDGCPLSGLPPGSVSTIQLANAGLQIISALQAVHAVNVVHRDLKPENVFALNSRDATWSKIPSIKVLDFGLAKFQRDTVAHRTKSGVAVGTPSYMAPEQIWGEPITPATDVYALAEILFELVAGWPLFIGTTADVMKRKVWESVNVELPDHPAKAELEPLIQRSVARAAKDRPTLDDFAEVLRGLVAAEEAAAASATKVPLKRSKARLALALGGGALAAGAAIYLAARAPSAGELQATPSAPVQAESLALVLLTSEPSGAFVFDLEEKGPPLGKTPLRIELKGGKKRRVEVQLEGFEQQWVVVDGSLPGANVVLPPLAQAEASAAEVPPAAPHAALESPPAAAKIAPKKKSPPSEPAPAPAKAAPGAAAKPTALPKNDATSW